MKVLSLFDGISCARVALDKLGVPVEHYYASEIDLPAISVSKKNWPKIEHIGNVEMLRGEYFADKGIDLLIGGSPCQDLSIAKAGRQGLAGERSKLFWEYVRILKEAKPKYFILENVASMSKEAKAQITEIMGVEPIMIDAALVSAQQRKRLFWTNIPGVTQPDDRGILLKDVIESGLVDRDKAYCIDANYFKGGSLKNYLEKKRRQVVLRQSESRLMVAEPAKGMVRVGNVGNGDSMGNRVYDIDGKAKTLSANGGGWGAKTGLYIIQVPRGNNPGGLRALDGKTPTLTSSKWEHNNHLALVDDEGNCWVVRKLTPVECERLQGLPDKYTDHVSNTQRYKACGNAFNADVIAHILSFIPEADRA